MTALEVRELCAGYGSAQVLFGVDLGVGTSEVLAVLGRNGMGKSTLVRAILGLTAVSAGKVQVAGRDVTGWPSHRVARAGVGWVPEGRQIFMGLTTEENLLVSARKGTWTLDKIYELFPRLQERKHHYGNQISGGEQQMLAIARGLMTNPDCLIMDEPSEGLAPIIIQAVWQIVSKLKQEGLSILLVEQNAALALQLVDYVHVISKGRVVYSGTPRELWADDGVKSRYLGI